MDTRVVEGSAGIQGELWGARAQDWAEIQEWTQRQIYHAVFEAAGVGSGTRLLDAGCGSGLALALALARGAEPTGLDAAEGFVAIARRRLPDVRIDLGELEALPYDEGSFDVVIGFNSFQYAANPVHALAEARRVAVPGGTVAIVTWGRRDQCEAAAILSALGSFLPPPPPGAGGPFALSEPGALAALIEEAGLSPFEEADIETEWVYPDLDTALRAHTASGPAVRAIRAADDEEAVRAALTSALGPYRGNDGSYRLENVFRYLLARSWAGDAVR